MIYRVTANKNEWCNKWHLVTTSGTTSDNQLQQVTTRDSE